MTEDKDESKVHIPYAAKVVTSDAQENKGGPRGVHLSEEKFKAEARDIMPKRFNSRLRTLAGLQSISSPKLD